MTDELTDEQKSIKAREAILSRGEDKVAKVAFLNKYGKSIPPDLMQRLPPKLRNPKVFPESEPKPPLPQKLKERRILIMRSAIGLDAMTIWVDDQDSCSRADVCHGGLDPFKPQSQETRLFHVYRQYPHYRDPNNVNAVVKSWLIADPWQQWERVSIRCPRSLTEDEWKRIVVDVPEGTGWREVKDWLAKNGRVGKQYEGDKKRPRAKPSVEDWD